MKNNYFDLKVTHLVTDELLEDRFTHLWTRCLRPGADCDAHSIYARLAAHYTEPHRHYHDKNHLAHCLEQLDLAAASVAAPDAVEMAIWFHDIINEPGSADDEQRSADLFRDLATGCMDPGFVDRVVDLIMVTTHRTAPVDADQRFICDIDLASFGCPWECFMRDSTDVKKEFSGTEEEYYRGKTAFLHAMLQRPRIFLTDFFNQRYERQSRENITRLLKLIERRAD